MAKTPTIKFAEKAPESCAVLIALADKDLKLGPITKSLGVDDLVERAAEKTGFTGKALSTLDILVPESVDAGRLIIVGSGANDEMVEADWLKLGGKVFAAAVSGKATSAFVLLERADGEEVSAKQAADFAAGMKLRSYMFDRYKTKKKENNGEDNKKDGVEITIVTVAAKEATKLWKQEQGVVDGVFLARDLVNEPANILGTEEFAEKAKELGKLGVEVTVLDEKAMKKEKMGALLGVAQGSVRPPLLAIMHWKGNDETPLAFIGKGVVFDTGGISMKPAGGMEEMKGDMGGAAAVTGLMHALAARKAKANVIGVIGLVENMPDANAQRPGDIVTSKSGQTIEVINTDAEGRLVLCDALTYVAEKYEPQFMIDLATLTGAILVALGHQNAGLFSNDDSLSVKLVEAGQATGETLWRMPLSSEYDKLIDSKTADMKNVGPRWGGSISAAQFLQRFVGKTPWAHLDIAGTAMGGSLTETNRSWGTGYGVRLLDRLVRDNYEK